MSAGASKVAGTSVVGTGLVRRPLLDRNWAPLALPTKARAEKRTLVVCIMETEVGEEKKNDAVDKRERGCQWARISKHGVKRLTVKV